MPKAYSDGERELIKSRLRKEASDCLVRFGAKKTTVDELVRRVRIPKGTFYLLYPSKELLFYDVICSFHDEIHKELRLALEAFGARPCAEELARILFGLYKKVDGSVLFHIMTNGDLELVMRKLPVETVRAHALQDDFSIGCVLSAAGIGGENAKVFSAALRAVFLSTLHRREIGEDEFDGALELLLRGVALQIFKGDAV